MSLVHGGSIIPTVKRHLEILKMILHTSIILWPHVLYFFPNYHYYSIIIHGELMVIVM